LITKDGTDLYTTAAVFDKAYLSWIKNKTEDAAEPQILTNEPVRAIAFGRRCNSGGHILLLRYALSGHPLKPVTLAEGRVQSRYIVLNDAMIKSGTYQKSYKTSHLSTARE
jgi:hypothetical protein